MIFQVGKSFKNFFFAKMMKTITIGIDFVAVYTLVGIILFFILMLFLEMVFQMIKTSSGMTSVTIFKFRDFFLKKYFLKENANLR